jgi:hypothetical protein
MYGIDTDNHHQEWKKGKVMQGWPVKLSKSEKERRLEEKINIISGVGVKGFISNVENRSTLGPLSDIMLIGPSGP